MGKVGRGDVNELRFDDHDNGYTGLDSQKNHFNNNGYLRPIGSFAVTPTDKITALANFSVGPEQNRSQMRGGINNRFIVDTSVVYTEASRRAFSLQNHGTTPTSHAQNTLTVARYYSFFRRRPARAAAQA
jgi:hypothetical protein